MSLPAVIIARFWSFVDKGETSLPEMLTGAVEHYMRGSMAKNTRRGYNSDCRIFAAWCLERNLSPFPAVPGTVAAFVADQARAGELTAATIARRLAAIARVHRAKGWPAPVDDRVREIMAGIRRELGTAAAPRAPLIFDDLQKLLAVVDSSNDSSIMDCRDRAILLVGWFAALRRSELAALCVEDITQAPEGLILAIRRSKTDQDGTGQEIGLLRVPERACCPVLALQVWLSRAQITTGPVFRRIRSTVIDSTALSPYSIALVIKRRARLAGLDSSKLSGHSLRSGALTSGALAGANLHKLKELSRHKSLSSLQKYVLPVEIFKDHALAGVNRPSG